MIKRFGILVAATVLVAGAATADAAINARDDRFSVVSSSNPFKIVLRTSQLLANDRLSRNPRALFEGFRRTRDSAGNGPRSSFGIANIKLRKNGSIAVFFKRNFVGETRFVYSITRRSEFSRGNVKFNVVSPN